MNSIKFLKIIADRWMYIIAIPLVAALIVFLLTMKIPPTFKTSSTLYSGVTSNTGLSVDIIRVDNVATQNEYNNILTMLNSVSFFKEVSLHLLAQHLMQEKPNNKVFAEDTYNELQKNAPDEVKKLVVKNDFETTLANLRTYVTEDENNYIYRLMHYGHKYYSIQTISNIRSERLSASDLIRISYESDDAGVCYNTVKFAVDIFISRYSGLKISQSNSAVAYFEKKLKETQEKLDVAEQKLLEFNVDNDIINYYEQTEQITTQQEKIELRLQDVKMEYEASIAVLEKLEKEIAQRYKINLRNAELLRIRQQLVQHNNAITSIEINGKGTSEVSLMELIQKRLETEKTLEHIVDSLNIYENKSQGIESQRILSQWLDAVKQNESSSAQFKSMQLRLVDFMLQFKRFAPLGATLKRYEREIGVYESEYLSILHHLGLARQNEQNINMRSNMRIYDGLNFPINAIHPPRKLYMIAIALFALIFYILAVFIIELLDTRIKTPSNLKKLSGMDVLAAFAKPLDSKDLFTPLVNLSGAKLIYDFVRVKSDGAKKPFVIQIASNWDSSGRRCVLASIVKLLKEQQHSFEIINLDNHTQLSGFEQDELKAMRDVSGKLSHTVEYSNLVENPTCDFVLSLIAPISNGLENPSLLSSASLTLMVFDAGSSWSDADIFMLNKARKAISHEMQVVLTKAIPDNLEEVYGEIPKKRSAFRKLIKKIVSRVVH